MAGQVVPARLGTLWGSRRILSLLVTRDLKVKYADSVLGYIWSILDPLMMAGVYWFVFTVLMTRQLGEDPVHRLPALRDAALAVDQRRRSAPRCERCPRTPSWCGRRTCRARSGSCARSARSSRSSLFAIPVLIFFAVLTARAPVLVRRVLAARHR